MTFVPVPDTVKAEFIYIADGQRCENVHYFELTGGFSPTQFYDLGAALNAEYVSMWPAMYPSTVSLVQVVITDMTFAAAPGSIYTTDLPTPGTRAGAQLPNNVALCFTKHTVLRGRSYRGRTYFGPLVEGDVTNHVANAAVIDGAITRFERLRSFTVGTDTWQMMVVSTISGGVPRAEGVTTPIVSISTDGYVDSQRRRLPGRGA